MQAGLLRDKITIERSDVTHNTENGEQGDIVAASVEWSRKGGLHPAHSWCQTMRPSTPLQKKVTIRTKPAFNEKLSNLRILIDGEYYRILAKDVRSRDMATIFTCELINE